LGPFAGPTSISEDCLYLNVFTTGWSSAKKKPVIVWIHGGGNIAGASNDYDGGALAKGGSAGVETVVVTINYRLGLFGTFSHPAIDGEGHPAGNYALMDQQAALRWVQRNIAAFGGDPARVAIAGQSAGALSVGAHLLAPSSRGLFSRAILQSSPAFAGVLATASSTIERGQHFAAAAGCEGEGPAAAKCLRDLSAARILQFQGTPAAGGPYTSSRPFVDGVVIPITPEQAWSTGRFNRTPVMGGSTQNETAFFTGVGRYFASGPAHLDAAAYAAAVLPGSTCQFCDGGKIPEGAGRVYPLTKYGGDPAVALERLHTDPIKCEELHVLEALASWVPTYGYDFEYQRAPYYFPKMDGFSPRAAHTIDIQFFFHGFHGGQLGVNSDQDTGKPRELDPEEAQLSDQMIAAWTNFANLGDPNGARTKDWPRLVAGDGGLYAVEDIPWSTTSVLAFRAQYQCDFWDKTMTY
jgi:para-nitrobenzyl esterase